MDLLVDPVLYAVPTANGDSEAHILFIESLSRWNEEIKAKRHNFFVWFDCIDALYEADCFPDPQKLRSLWLQIDEEVISPDLAFIACLSLLDPPYLDEWLEDPSLNDLLVDENFFDMRPDLLNRLPTIVAEAFLATLGKIAYIKEKKQDTRVSNLQLVTHPVAGNPVAAISAHVASEDQSDVVFVETKLPLIMHPDELENLDDIWQDTITAIQWVAREMKRQGDLSETVELAPFLVHDTFVSTIQKYHFDKNQGYLKQIFRKCVLLLAGLIPPDPNKHHTLNKNQQKTHGEWGAWRLHITGSPIAIRLHYWRHENRYILMHIVPHENFDIDSPPADAFC